MNDPANAAVEPAYIARLALKAIPFRQEVEPQFFFYGEQIEQRLNLLSHLVRASEKVAFVFAAKGIGKTSLLKQLQQTAGDELRVCYFDIQSSSTPSQLLTECMRCFGAEPNDNFEQQQRLLKERLQRLRNLNIRPVLLIDNIDKAESGSEISAFIFTLFSWKDDDSFLLQGVLTASSVVAEWDNLHGRLQRIDLPRLAEHELPAYLMHRLRVAGYQGENPFNGKQLKHIYHHSSGCPANINQLAHQMLLGLPSAPRPIARYTLTFSTAMRWMMVLFIAAVLLLLLVFQDEINAFFSVAQPHDRKEGETIEMISDDEPVTMVVVQDEHKADTKPKVDGREELVQLVSELEQIQHSAPKEEPKLENTLTQEQKTVEPTLVRFSDTHDENWIMQQDSHHYTFQLMGSWQRSEVLDFIDKYALTGEMAIFESMRNGRTWYALVYGVYPGKQQALEASKHWPAPLNTLPSWLRRFDSVQKQIKNKVITQ